MSTIDELRQQLSDVSHERDLLRAALGRADYVLSTCSYALNSVSNMRDQNARIDWYANQMGPAKEKLLEYFSEKSEVKS